MEFLSKCSYRCLYILWGGLFGLTAVLGLLFPGVENGVGLFFLRLVTLLFFLPPWMILAKARIEGLVFHVRLLRYLSLASLAFTLLLFCAGILTAVGNPELGDLIHVLMAIVCAPLVCSNFYVLPMFLWATVLAATLGKK